MNDNLIQYPLHDLLEVFEEEDIKKLFSSFICERNKDVQEFLVNTALNNENIHKSRTYLLLKEDDLSLIGYYSIANKVFEITDNISKTKMKEIRGSVFPSNDKHIPSLLIGQLGKSDGAIADRGRLLNEALLTVIRIHLLIGLRIIYLECENNPKIISYYEEFNFEVYRDKNNNPILHGDLIVMFLFIKDIKSIRNK